MSGSLATSWHSKPGGNLKSFTSSAGVFASVGAIGGGSCAVAAMGRKKNVTRDGRMGSPRETTINLAVRDRSETHPGRLQPASRTKSPVFSLAPAPGLGYSPAEL